jgi:hypothetical protein
MGARSTRLPFALELVTAVGLIAFWIGFFTVGFAPPAPPAGYLQYEQAFPLPDLLLAAALLVAAAGLRKERAWAPRLSLVCAGALVFLGVLDFSFNVQNGIYALSAADLALNAVINLWCVAVGTYLALALG